MNIESPADLSVLLDSEKTVRRSEALWGAFRPYVDIGAVLLVMRRLNDDALSICSISNCSLTN